jgi:uncharacterized membrane protein YidH (DUF202 family)
MPVMPLPFRDRVRRGGLPVLLAPLGVVVAAALVAAASRAHGGFHGGVGPGPTRSVYDQLFTVMLVLMGVGVLAWGYLIFVRRDLIELPEPERSRRNVYVLLAFVLGVAAFAVLAKRLGYHGLHLPFLHHPLHAPPGLPTKHGAKPVPAAPAHAHLSWIAGLATTALLALAAAAVFFASRTTAQPEKRALRQAEAVSAALDESIADVLAEPDPRRAIIAAYAHMERALAAAGLPRRPAEAPLEYLERALVDLDATAASARRLTDLFRFAKFSDHPVPGQAKDDAIAALEAVRDELRGVA